jgi:methane/ammonia monooxygenase subunit B
MIRRLGALSLVLVILILAGPAAQPAAAHGERTQEAFLRSSTVLLYDVEYSTVDLAVGQPLTVTGSVRIMRSWPDRVVGPPETGFLSLAMPGPVFAIKDRRLNGVFVPQSVHIERGATYRFEVTAVAREEGRWHVHPSLAVEGTGTLVGAGEWITVRPGTFTNTVALADGSTVDLTNHGMIRVVLWHVIGALVGLAWIAYWLRRPLLARSALVARGEGRRLIRPGDRRTGLIFGVVALAVLGGGVLVTNATIDGSLLPLQVARAEVAPLPPLAATVDATVTSAEWRANADELVLMMSVRNTGGMPVRLSQIQIAELTLRDLGTDAVAPGATSPFALRIPGPVLREHNLLPLQEPQVRLTALLFFTDDAGGRQLTEIDELTSPVLPR